MEPVEVVGVIYHTSTICSNAAPHMFVHSIDFVLELVKIRNETVIVHGLPGNSHEIIVPILSLVDQRCCLLIAEADDEDHAQKKSE